MEQLENKRKLLLISNSFCFGKGYLEHCASEVKNLLGDTLELLFIPYALKDWDRYLKIAQEGFAKMGIQVKGIHKLPKKITAINTAPAIFVGGGNTFRLLNQMYKENILELIVQRINNGTPYLGASAGANMACPTIKTTNDMPIIFPPSFNALNLVPFQINPHYIDPDPTSKHMGETRDKRIAEFHEENETVVVGLREGSWIMVKDGFAHLGGETGAKIFRKNESPVEWEKSSSKDCRFWLEKY